MTSNILSFYSNYDDVLRQLRDYGLIVDGLDINSARFIRCRVLEDKSREKRGWYRLNSFVVDGESLIIGAYGIYQGNDPGKQLIKLPKEKKGRLTPEQIEAQKAQQREATKRAEADRQREANHAAARAASVWKKCSTEGSSEYLERKQVASHGIRFTDTGALVVPMYDAKDCIRGLQFIFPRGHERKKKTGRDKEFWPSGLLMGGTFHLIGGIPRNVLLVAEGYATAASLHEATGLPVAIVWSANNVMPACKELKKKFKRARQLICADDDWLQTCAACGKFTTVETELCDHCGQHHGKQNAGCVNAEAAAVSVGGAWIKPHFGEQRPSDKKGPTDFNDLHVLETLASVHRQVDDKLTALKWLSAGAPNDTANGGGARGELKSMLTIDEATDRFALVYGGKGTMFDYQEHILVPKVDVLDILPEHGWRDMRALKKVVRLDEVGFDPSGTDHRITCNLWAGWPTVPKSGRCDMLLELLEYLCSGEENYAEVYQWALRWLAYPIQNPGAKMKTALVFHGPQGTGKNLFFESYMAIYDIYGRIIDQAAIEDKFNDWASRKLFLIADEVVARNELFHVKNKLKSFVTGEWIRINPKNVAAHDERNHVNLVFLSNESQPLALEKDDRRYFVIHTPSKLEQQFYQLVRDEINAGGIAALHDYLLKLPMTYRDKDGTERTFDEHTKPPLTKAKVDLIDIGLDSVSSFLSEWAAGELEEYPFCPCLGTHLYQLYRKWCEWRGERSPRSAKQFIGSIRKLEGWRAGEPVSVLKRIGETEIISRKMVIPPDELLMEADYWQQIKRKKREEMPQKVWLAECFFAFAQALGVDA